MNKELLGEESGSVDSAVSKDVGSTKEHLSEVREKLSSLTQAISKVVVGQTRMISRLLVGLFSQGHVLLEGPPGLAKTLTVNVLAKSLGLSFSRIQFTPDLLPSDLIGTMIYHQAKAAFEVKKGPIFTNILLADEINRAPAKVQSALLECMQERQVTIGEESYVLDSPFLVLATQNPIEQSGTYPLPEAQLDRFMMRVFVTYPTVKEELAIMERMSSPFVSSSSVSIVKKAEIFGIQKSLEGVEVSGAIARYIVSLVLATRSPKEFGVPMAARYIRYGSSPRGSIYLHRAARALACMDGRDYVLPEDVKAVAMEVLNHRLVLHYEADADNVSSADIIGELLEKVPLHG